MRTADSSGMNHICTCRLVPGYTRSNSDDCLTFFRTETARAKCGCADTTSRASTILKAAMGTSALGQNGSTCTSGKVPEGWCRVPAKSQSFVMKQIPLKRHPEKLVFRRKCLSLLRERFS